MKVTAQSCGVEYADWVKNVDNEDDIEKNVLIPDTGTSTNVDAIDNPKFGDDYDTPQVTTDTMLNRINTTFEDAANTPDTNYTHWIFSRAFRLPSGDTYDNLKDLNKNGDTTSENLVTLAFIHAGRIDGTSDDWLVPFIKKYRQGCHNRPVNVVLFGAIVRLNGTRHYDDSFSHGSKWHITSSKWGDNNTVVFDVMSQSEKVVSGHSTVNCPFDNNDTNIAEVYVGGGHETSARRVSSRFGEKSLYVGENSDSQSVCYSGVTTGNPVNAGERGIQFEYNVDLKGDSRAKPEEIAQSVIAELQLDTKPYVVDKDGYAGPGKSSCSDTTAGSFRLPQTALNQTTGSDTVAVCPGTYSGNIRVDTPEVNLTSKADSDKTILRSSNDTNPAVRITSDSVTLTGLTIKSDTTGIAVTGANNGYVASNRLISNDYKAVEAKETIDFVAENNVFRNNGSRGLFFENDTGTVVRENLLEMNNKAINFAQRNYNYSIKNNQILGNDTGVIVKGKSNMGDIHLNNFSGNTVGLYYSSEGILNAESNWWDNRDGPGTEISDAVTGGTTPDTGSAILLNESVVDSGVAFEPYLENNPDSSSVKTLDNSDTLSLSGDTQTASVQVNHDSNVDKCGGDTVEFFGSEIPSNLQRIQSFPNNTSKELNNANFDTMLAEFNMSANRRIGSGCLTLTLNASNLSPDQSDTFSIALYEDNQWKSVGELKEAKVISDTAPNFIFKPPHLSSFSVLSAASSNSDDNSGSTSDSGDGSSDVLPGDDDSSCVIESFGIEGNLLNDLRGLRDRILTSVAGRWLVGLYYTAN